MKNLKSNFIAAYFFIIAISLALIGPLTSQAGPAQVRRSLGAPVYEGGRDVQEGQRTLSPARRVERDVKFERVAVARYRKIGALLQPEAKRKLAVASSEVLKGLAKNSNPGDLLD